MNVEILSRIQFAFTITFHYIYPPMSIGLSLAMIFMEALYLKTKNPIWEKLTKFWLKVFSMTFALGVATGIPMMFSLGTNWARYSRFVSDVSGSIIGAEGMFAFLIEAGFLGVLLFGWDKVKPKIHFMATCLVSLGAHFSAVWIVSFNSWMQTPSGYKLTVLPDGTEVAQVTKWGEVFFSPSNMSHIGHVLLGAWMTGAFMMMSISAYYLLKGRHTEFAIKSMKIGLFIGIVTTVLQLISADRLSQKVAKHNPEKFAAFEGVYKTEKSTPAYIIGWVDHQNEKVHGIKIPGLLSFMTYHDFETPVPGLDQFPKEEWSYVPAVFQFYHIMVLSWGAMALASCLGGYYWLKQQWSMHPIVLKYFIISVAFPQIGNISGWYSACMGRQPYVVYKLLKTKEAFSPVISAGQVMGSLIMFVVMYLLFFVLFLVMLDKKIKNGPDIEHEELPYRDVYSGESHG
ncbi:MAG: cytochrome ubiquinol oxidase subunit I [Candidatus Rhabdochlamydia sp.]